MGKIKKSRSGLTLIELILSIAIIAMIIISFMPLFAMSAKNNRKSEDTLSATYLGKDAMELAYHLSKTVAYDDLESQMLTEGYTHLSDHEYEIESEGKYIHMSFFKNDKLVKVLVKVYQDETRGQVEVQYESLYIW